MGWNYFWSSIIFQAIIISYQECLIHSCENTDVHIYKKNRGVDSFLNPGGLAVLRVAPLATPLKKEFHFEKNFALLCQAIWIADLKAKCLKNERFFWLPQMFDKSKYIFLLYHFFFKIIRIVLLLINKTSFSSYNSFIQSSLLITVVLLRK